MVNLSIDHVGEKHNWIRSVPGNYEKAKKTYAGLVPLREKYGNLTVNVHTCLCSYNADDLDKLFVAVRRDFPDDLVPFVRDAAQGQPDNSPADFNQGARDAAKLEEDAAFISATSALRAPAPSEQHHVSLITK